MANPRKKDQIHQAQAKHLADLFGDKADQVKPAPTQAANDHQRARAASLGQAAKAKEAALNQQDRATLDRLRQQPSRPAPPRSAQQPVSPATAPPRPPQPRPPGTARKAPPSPEELDRLLREMAQRAAQRAKSRPAGAPPRPMPRMPRPAMPGMPPTPEFGGDAAPAAEAPPEAPPEEPVEKNRERQAEIIEKLQAKESQAKQHIKPIPQADQQRAKEEPVEASVPIRTEANAVSSAPLHQAIAQLQQAMRVHDPKGQVYGVNVVQQQIPGHPMSQVDDNPPQPPTS